MTRRNWPAPPDDLHESSRELWTQIVGTRAKSPERIALVRVGLEALDRANEAKALIDSEGMTFKTETTGAIHVHPAVRIEKDSRALFARIWTALALNWSSQVDGR